MASPKREELFVQFVFPCECGVELHVHGEHFVGFPVGRESVTCPKCGKEHVLPTKPLRFFYREEGNAWKVVFLDSNRAVSSREPKTGKIQRTEQRTIRAE